MRYRALHVLWFPVALLLIIPSSVLAQETNELDEPPAAAITDLVASQPTVSAEDLPGERSTASEQAQQQDRVRILLNHVRDDQREQFEEFVYERLIPAILQHAQDDAQHRRAFQQTRVLEPSQQNDDGTWTYVFLMDPLVEDFAYSFEDAFEGVYTDEEAEQYIQQFQDALDRPQESYTMEMSEMW